VSDYSDRKQIERKDLTTEDVAPKNKRRVLIILGFALVAAFLLLQIHPLLHDFSNPPVLTELRWDSEQTYQLTRRACWDCHSNETAWPWYTKIAPFSMVLVRDVEAGREAMNFSEWATGGAVDTEEMVETISKNQMPPPFYLILHPEADLNNDERSDLINGLIATLEQNRYLETEELDASDPEETGDDVELPTDQADTSAATEEAPEESATPSR
jgi:hypothetical protein